MIDPPDCERPACDDVKDLLSKAMPKMKPAAKAKAQCPVRSSELGHSSWNLLHTMTAWYPDAPSSTQQTKMKQFLVGLAEFYPCTWCAADFQKNIEEHPPKVESRKELCQWMCEQHNLVNEKLGKPAFRCDMRTLDERWRKSKDPRCHK
uniref:Sulfhydryl oxidase n=1 Tax=Craspedostauros australis TaxID=1486917 RepID=A0A6T6F8I9_9STRA